MQASCLLKDIGDGPLGFQEIRAVHEGNGVSEPTTPWSNTVNTWGEWGARMTSKSRGLHTPTAAMGPWLGSEKT
jgi:hypothetical protein